MRQDWIRMFNEFEQEQSPEALSQELRKRSADFFRVFNGGLETVATNGLPESVANGVATHNRQVAEFIQKRVAWCERYISLPIGMADPAGNLAEVIQERHSVLAGQVQIFNEHLGLLESLHALLPDVVAARRELQQAAETALVNVREKTAKALKKAGVSAESDPRYSMNAEAAEARFKIKVNEAEPVRATMQAAEQARVDANTVERQNAAVPRQVAIVEVVRYWAAREAVGF